MRPNNPATNIDRSVIFTMVVLILLCFVVLSFRYRSYKPCNSFAIRTQAFSLYTGKIIRFDALLHTVENNELAWDFGDNSPIVKNETIVNHIYQIAGRYEISLTINGKCKEYTTIEIATAPATFIKELQPQFLGPHKVYVGDPAKFFDFTPNAKQWEWWFGENNTVDATSKDAVYTFRTPGTKNVILMVNGKMKGEYIVLVEPKPFNDETKKIKTPSKHDTNWPIIKEYPSTVSKDTQEEKQKEDVPKRPDAHIKTDSLELIFKKGLENVLKDVIEGRKNAVDIANNFCTQGNTPVVYNGTKMTLNQLYLELYKIKKSRKVELLSVGYEKDDHTNCILNMKVTIRIRRTFLGL